MIALQHPPANHFANLYLPGEHYLVTELQGLRIADEVLSETYPMSVSVHPLRCGVDMGNGNFETFNAFRACATEASKAEPSPEHAVWSQRVASVIKATGSRTLLVTQGVKTNDNLPKGIRTMLLQGNKKSKTEGIWKISQARMVIYDMDWDLLYPGYLLAMHRPHVNPWA